MTDLTATSSGACCDTTQTSGPCCGTATAAAEAKTCCDPAAKATAQATGIDCCA
jgi:hypothetical protein